MCSWVKCKQVTVKCFNEVGRLEHRIEVHLLYVDSTGTVSAENNTDDSTLTHFPRTVWKVAVDTCLQFAVSALGYAAVLFMEHWKRRQMRLNYIWDLTGFGEEEEVRQRLQVTLASTRRKIHTYECPS